MNRSEPTISAVIITYNEEAQIADCIRSVHDWCDEVLILDPHSTDRTAEIAGQFSKVKFRTHDFDGHVQQKNRAIEYSRGDWVFSLDADERASPELAEAVRTFVRIHPNAPGARIKRLTYHLGRYIRHGGWYNARYRLIRRGEGIWAGENPHDSIRIRNQSTWQMLRSPILNGQLIHYSFKDLSDQVDTINKFSSIVAFTRAGRGKRASILKMLVKPVSKFVEMYVVKAGFLDGVPGFIIAISSAYSAFLKWAKLYELRKTEIKRPSNLRAGYQVDGADTE
ncbi:MAG: glycosyltransferase family 2 protein [Leptospiraceae bacterium]|nr:glycosyltransferase family 2 protein [Leptospiraceae bacterium]